MAKISIYHKLFSKFLFSNKLYMYKKFHISSVQNTWFTWKNNVNEDIKNKMSQGPAVKSTNTLFDKIASNFGQVKQIALAEQKFSYTLDKDKNNFLSIINSFKNDHHRERLGQVEFIFAALKKMKEFGVHKDIQCYKALMDIFPKGRMVPTNFIQSLFVHYPKQQLCALLLLSEMEYNRIYPDKEMENLVTSIFGKESSVWKKVGGLAYWQSKLRFANPFPLPLTLPKDAKELAKIALRRMSTDLSTKISVLSTSLIKDALDITWIVSAQSPIQIKILEEINEPIYVEGPYRVWIREYSLSYFVIRTGPKEIKEPEPDDMNDVSNLSLHLFGSQNIESIIEEEKQKHIQSDGIILGMCATGTSSRDSLLSWIRILEKFSPKLSNLQVIFTLKAPTTDLTINQMPKKVKQIENNKV